MVIYKIENKINGKIYIGQTIRTIRERWMDHISATKTGHGCPALSNAIDKYGVDNFTISEIEKCNTKEELDERERYWILMHKSNDYKFGYNLTTGGDGGNTYKYLSHKRLEEVKTKISESKLGCKNPHHQGVKCKNIETGEEMIFGTVKECSEYFNTVSANISGRCTNRIKSLLHDKYLIAYANKDYPTKCKKYVAGANRMIAVEVVFDKYTVKFDSLTEFYKAYNLRKIDGKVFKNSDEIIYKGYHIRKVNKCVSTIPDECKGVGLEMSTNPKR